MNGLWLELQEMAPIARLSNLSAQHVIGAFLANYLAALLLMRMHDVEGARLIRDPVGARLTGLQANMSDPNFWTYVALFPRDKHVRARLGSAEAEKLYTMAGWVSTGGAKKAAQLLQTPPDLVNWEQAYYTLALMKDRFNVNSTFLNRVAPVMRTWARRSSVEQSMALSNTFQYLLQSDPNSKLLPRLRDLAQGELTHAAATGTGFRSFFRMSESDGAVAGGTSAASIGTNSGSMTGGDSGNAIITPPGFQTASGQESPVGTLWNKSDRDKSKELLGKMYKQKLGNRKPARLAKIKSVKRTNNKVIRKKRRDFLPRQFKDPELNSRLGDNSNVRPA